MKFYDETKPLYLKTDASGIELGATLLQTRQCITCPKDTAPDNAFLGQSHLQVKASPVQSRSIVT